LRQRAGRPVLQRGAPQGIRPLKTIVLLDTGPLVASLNRRDRHHSWTVDRLGEIEPPLLTCDAVLTEACFLLKKITGGQRAVLDLVERGLVVSPLRVEEEAPALRRLLERYASMEISLADACLIRMSEQFPSSVVLTLDSGFEVYRRHGRQVIPSLRPDAS
jgi:predicted nucleic acid-binding protein